MKEEREAERMEVLAELPMASPLLFLARCLPDAGSLPPPATGLALRPASAWHAAAGSAYLPVFRPSRGLPPPVQSSYPTRPRRASAHERSTCCWTS